MKKLITLLGFLTLISFQEYERQFKIINQDEISSIMIKKDLYDSIAIKFNKNEITEFVNLVNSHNKLLLIKSKPKYWIFVKNKNGELIKFKLLNNYLGSGDWYKKTDKITMFKNIYESGTRIKRQ